jgi:hypothetical protein
MNQAAAQDPRGVLVWPVIQKVLAGSPPPDALTRQAADLVTTWVDDGGKLLDTTGDGKVDMPGAVILDQAWGGIVDAVLSPVLGNLVNEIPPDGDMSYVDKDLRTMLGQPVKGRYSQGYCGAGVLSACRTSLWSALQHAANVLVATQGPDPHTWRLADQPITFIPGVLPNTMPYTNRPTFQQVVSFGQ